MGYIRDRWRDPARVGKGRRWQVKVRVDGRERDGGTYDTKDMAKRRLVELEAAAQRGAWVDLTDRTTVAEAARAYIATRPYKPGTLERVDGYVRNHIEGTTLGPRRLTAVRPSDVQSWVTDRSAAMAPTTLRALVKFVRSVFRAAVDDHRIARSPFVRITLPRHEPDRIVPLTVDQVRTLAEAVPARHRALVLAQAGLGLRIGELLALRVVDVDFLRRTARVEHQIDRRTRDRVPPKTPRSRRTIPLPNVVGVALAEHLAEYGPAADGLIFHTAEGRPLLQEYVSRNVFGRAVRRTDLPASTTSHDLRHHYASILLAAGESVLAVAERLGHEDATLVLTTYGHLMPDSEDRTRKAVDGAWSGQPGPLPAEARAAQVLPG
ncbi:MULTISPECIES: site-specific integrase [unclassified Pseudonocardia]|uniref:tyrosine-type recombinase/integrase n=1 Tax=unclassified Pseudonocardia TaxID=2619320 RepID=UPI0001FFE2CC|nr:site-specific integrase [Pseudonocardia sp. Ae707_Ps1]OLM20849.1 Integrase [Pseudonocardia sp. Ae707_Ps1]